MKKRVVGYIVLAAMVAFYLIGRTSIHVSRTSFFENEEAAREALHKNTVSGNYLAARFAVSIDDLKSAAYFYDRSIVKAQEKELLVQRALPAAIGAGEIDQALKLSKDMDFSQPNMSAQLAVMLSLVNAFQKNDTAAIAKYLPMVRDDGFGRLLSPLLNAWNSVLLDKTDLAIQRLDEMQREYPTIKSLVNAQKAFIYQVKGQNDKAEDYYKKSFDENISLRSAWMVGQFYEQQGKLDKAAAIYKQMVEKNPDAPLLKIALVRLQDQKTQKLHPVKTVQDGVAAALYDVASVLNQESSARIAVLYAQMAYHLTPDDPFVNLLLGDIFAGSLVKETAAEFYNKIDPQDDLYMLAQFRLASLYENMGDIDNALLVLGKMSGNPIVKRQALAEIADIYRRQEDFAQAVPYYTQVIEGIKKPQEGDWSIFYARAICLERNHQWEEAEKDLLKALKLSPDQPEVLNYLAYTWVDHGKNMQKALEMLQRALASAPQDPYIIDSVGWTLFRLGQYEQAVDYLETAVQGLPDDFTVNDHLGDAYWKVGRYIEAQFQWKRALKSVSEKDKAAKQELNRKLDQDIPETTIAEPDNKSSK